MTLTVTMKMGDQLIVYFSTMLIDSLTITVVDLNEVAFMSVLVTATVNMDDPTPAITLINKHRAKKYWSERIYTKLK